MTHDSLSKQSRTSQPTVCELDSKYLGIFEISKNMAHVPLPNQSHTYQPQPTVCELNGKYDKNLGIFLKYLEYMEYYTRFIVTFLAQVNQQSAN